MLNSDMQSGKTFQSNLLYENSKELFGYNHEELLKGTIKVHELVHPDDLPIISAIVFKIAKNKTLISFKPKPFRIITKKGKNKSF